MDVKELVEIIKENTDLDPQTLIFNPEKSEEFIAQVQENNPGRIAFLPVRPDWNEAKKVFGYYNPLTGLFYPTDGLKVLLNAFRALMLGNKKEKYFIILDEMNLARVEYYFSDILSLMENMWKLKKKEIIRGEVSQIHPFDRCLLSKFPEGNANKWQKYVKDENGRLVWKDMPEKICQEECREVCPYYPLSRLALGKKIEVMDKEKIKEIKEIKEMEEFIEEFNPIPPRIAYPENLVIIGTVNVDETTFSFAPKVLDRAFVLEFTEVHWKEYLSSKQVNGLENFVEKLQDILKRCNMHFGYRVIEEMRKYLSGLKKIDNEAYDFLLKSKILPKLHGTEEQIGEVLIELLRFCAKDNEDNKDNKDNKENKENKENKDNFKQKITSENLSNKEVIKNNLSKPEKYNYPESALKILEMYQNMKATGYCSYF